MHSAVELLTGFLPGQRVEAEAAEGGYRDSLMSARRAASQYTLRYSQRARIYVQLTVVMLSTRRKEKDKERREFETQQRQEERARAMIPKDRFGLMAASMAGGPNEDLGPPIVAAYRDDLVENEDQIEEVYEFVGQWSMGALCCRRDRNARCNKLSMLCARASGKKAALEGERCTNCARRWASLPTSHRATLSGLHTT